ncbi:MAG: beta-ketoacyl-[acyl-carrier-protein] synthase family protein [Limisphaerales bacterium]
MLFPSAASNARHRVVVTGLGIVTAYGVGWETNAEGFRWGKTAFKPVTLFDVSRQRVQKAAEVNLPTTFPSSKLSLRKQKRMERAAKLLFFAVDEALGQASWPDGKAPLVFATTSGGMNRGEEFFRAATAHASVSRGQPTRVSYYLAQQQLLDLAEGYGLEGPLTIIANACAAGGNAIGHAYELIRSGRFERALTGGYDALSQMVFSGFDSLQALSPTVCRPFDAQRDGLGLGEGAAVLTLESLDCATRRGATILGEIAGYGAATDAHHLTQPHPLGEAAHATMRQACECAGIEPCQVAYINAHGTGTVLNDASEAAAINSWAGSDVAGIHVSSTKAGIGHLLGAAGAVEAAVCLMTLKEQWLPPMTTTTTPDPAVHFHLVQKPAKAKELNRPFEYALSNSFGFGGANASLLFRRFS